MNFVKEIETNPLKLQLKCKPVDQLTDNPILDEICMSLVDTFMAYADTAIGLAANQIGFRHRVILIKMGSGHVIMINPVIVSSIMHGRIARKESCLSFPNKSVKVNRYKRITVTYDAYSKELIPKQVHTYTGSTARTIQHEVDHLNGRLI